MRIDEIIEQNAREYVNEKLIELRDAVEKLRHQAVEDLGPHHGEFYGAIVPVVAMMNDAVLVQALNEKYQDRCKQMRADMIEHHRKRMTKEIVEAALSGAADG